VTVRYTPQARADIEQIYRYLRERNPGGAVNVLRAIYAGAQFIAEYPRAAPRTDNPMVRVKIVRRYRYKIFYRTIDDRTVEILHVRHTSRRAWEGLTS
jgi:plasmid stabilization system protein ParE